MMKNSMQMQQRLKGGQNRRRASLPKSQPADLMAKQAELVKAQQARRAATASNTADSATNARNLAIAQKANAGAAGGMQQAAHSMEQNRMQRMAKGGMTKGYAKGGMANCGASVKPNGGKKGT